MNSEEKYPLIQKTYPKDDDDVVYYHIESSETDVELPLDDIEMTVALDRKRFIIEWLETRLEIRLSLTGIKFECLKEILETRFKDRLRQIIRKENNLPTTNKRKAVNRAFE